jgi:hypothetical protein
MAKKSLLRRWIGGVAVIILFLPLILLINGYSDTKGPTARPDILKLAFAAKSGKPEMPSVAFLHDRHTEVLEKEGCQACHPSKNDKVVFKFKRLEDMGYDAQMKVYHDNCIGCHTKTASSGKASGPKVGDCRACHNEKQKLASSWNPIQLDKSLHFRHESAKVIRPAVASEETNCSACHHKYDELTKKTVYAKGEEESCRYCHRDQATKEARSIRNASHESCVSCHLSKKNTQQKAGPVKCGGCHELAEQKKIQVVKEVPRMKRNQPDTVLLANWLNAPDAKPEMMKKHMNPVAFNHIGHEKDVASCRTCHHQTLKRCGECHTETGSEKGKFIRLERAMHDMTHDTSCVSCHRKFQKEPNCAGCHEDMNEKELGKQTCNLCHGVDKSAIKSVPLQKESRIRIASDQLAGASKPKPALSDDQIPEKISIGVIADQFEPAEFPHRKIVKALYARMQGSRMANFYHRESSTMCMGCHHNSPASLTPPKCASCHGRPFEASADGRPGLKAAYHDQCMSCHQKMKIAKPAATACVECHKERKKTS